MSASFDQVQILIAFESKKAARVKWLKEYVNSPEFIEMYDTPTLELMAVATFWCVTFSLAPLIEKMSYAEICTFQPLDEINGSTERGACIRQVALKLENRDLMDKDSFSLGQSAWSINTQLIQAAWAIYVRKNSYEMMKKQKAIYENSIRSHL